MPTFTPPIVYDRPPFLPTTKGAARALFRYFPNRPRYVNVFQLSDGSFVQDTATTYATDSTGNVISVDFSNTNIPYPWNPYQPNAPYSTVYYTDYTQNPPRQVMTTVSQNPYIVALYGNGPTVVPAYEALLLTAAGYGPLIS